MLSSPIGTYGSHNGPALGPIAFAGQKRVVRMLEEPKPVRRHFVLGIDFGQLSDFTAFVVLEVGRQEGLTKFDCIHLERVPLGTKYPAQVQRIEDLYSHLRSLGNVRVVVDATGVGRGLIDMIGAGRVVRQVRAVTLTGGNAVSAIRHGEVSVPKRDVVSATKALLQTGRLRIAKNLPESDTLVRELLSFEASLSQSGHDSYGGRSGEHDDLVLALALAVWLAEPSGRSRAQLIV